jgi:Cellulose binding domain
MRVNHHPSSPIRRELLALVPVVLLACATGVDPVRPGTGGAGSGAEASTSSTSGLGGGTAGPGSTSATGGTATVSSTTSTSGTTSSTAASTGTTSTTSSTAASSSSSSGDGGTVMGLELQYLCADTNATDQSMKPHFQINNNGASTVDLSTLKIRYFFTKDGMPTSDQTYGCDYAKIGCANLAFAFGTWTGTNADEYAELSFLAAAGTLAPGASTGEMQANIHSTDYQHTLTQTNDYSFDPTKTVFTDWTQVTLYQNGTLVWGTEP